MNEFSADRPADDIRPDHLPPITTAAQLQARWELLIGTGFADRELYYAFLTASGTMAPIMSCIGELPRRPDRQSTANLMYVCDRVLDDIDRGGTVAMLLCRPGPDHIEPDDAFWARALLTEARAAGVRLEPIHLATDSSVRVFAADDLMEPAAAVTDPA